MVSPESAVYYAWQDIEKQHTPPQERVSFITRPQLFCSACGSAAMQEVFGAIRREVWCHQSGCVQEGKRLNVYDPVIDGMPHA